MGATQNRMASGMQRFFCCCCPGKYQGITDELQEGLLDAAQVSGQLGTPTTSQPPLVEEGCSAVDVASHRINMSSDNPLFAYTCGLAAALEAASERGDAAVFEPLRTEFERAMLELGATGFEEIVNTGELVVSAKTDPETGFLILKTVDMVPNSTVEELFRLTYEVETRAEWEKATKFTDKRCHKIAETVPGEDETYLFQYPGMLFVKGREFLDRRICFRDVARKLYVTISGVATTPDVAVDKKFIRGDTIFQANIVYETPEGAAHALIVLGNPKGSLPKSAVNQQSKLQPAKWHKALVKAYAQFARDTPVAPVVSPAAMNMTAAPAAAAAAPAVASAAASSDVQVPSPKNSQTASPTNSQTSSLGKKPDGDETENN